ncbi:DUF397 domain-containing protein [Actinomadura sediminis]|uniref:DUF397 domain-containing protein n=1 Tax=Actinomadura sediminis TaxID=1038904 RepID=A0ABW3ERR9_9ACTN
MVNLDPACAAFRKSSFSEGANGCVEAAVLGQDHLVRDSKDPDGGCLALDGGTWNALLTEIKRGVYDL